MTSAEVTAKAHRLLVTGRVKVKSADAAALAADVRGDHDTYRVVVIAGAPICSCRSIRLCSHGVAVALIAGARYRPGNPHGSAGSVETEGVADPDQAGFTTVTKQRKVRVSPVARSGNEPGDQEVTMSASAITVEQVTDAISKEWPESQLVEKQAYHRIQLGKVALAYGYFRGQRPALEVLKTDDSGKYAYFSVKTKADLNKAIAAMRKVEARAAKKAAAAAKKNGGK